MAKFTKEQKDAVKKHYSHLIKELNKTARGLGINDLTISGFIIKPKAANNIPLICPCGQETYIDPRTGKVEKRCKRC